MLDGTDLTGGTTDKTITKFVIVLFNKLLTTCCKDMISDVIKISPSLLALFTRGHCLTQQRSHGDTV